jgi:hypothetical protein
MNNMNSIKLYKLAALAAIVALPCAASAAISIGTSAQSFDSDSSGAINTLSDFEVVAGNDRKLVLAINAETGASLTGITFGSQSFIKAVDTGTSRLSQIWYLDDATVGIFDIVATWSANARSRMGVVSLTGAAAGGPSAFDTAASFIDADTTQASIDFTTTEANTFVIAAYTQNNGNGFVTRPASMDFLHKGDSGSSATTGSFQIQPIAGSTTYTWTAFDPFVINPSNGVAIASFSAVPEPSTFALLAGLVVLSCVALRRR